MASYELVLAWSVVVSLASGVPGVAAAGDDKAGELLTMTRAALGGAKVEAVKALSATGEFRRVFGEREISGELTIEIGAPDKMKRTEEMGIPGGPTFVRTAALSEGTFWEDSTNRGGGGGFMMRFGGPGGPGQPGQAPTEEERERFRQMQQRRLEGELQRYLLALLVRTSAPVTYAGTAEASDGKAEVLEFKPEGGQPMQLFIDPQTNLPLMLTYKGFRPRMVVRQPGQGGQPPSPEEIRRRMAEPPQEATFELRFDEYQAVDGVMLPHRITQSIEGTVSEEWTVSTFKVNPGFKPDTFSKK